MSTPNPASVRAWSERRTQRTRSAGLLAVGVVFFGLLFLAACAARAHDPQRHIVPENRVELSFGRSEDYDYDPPEPGSYRLPALGPAADGVLLDSRGRETRLRQALAGHISVLAFIYTRCSDPKGCPLSMALLHDLDYVAQNDPAVGEALRLVTVSFDPEHDTPEVMADYASGLAGRGSAEDRWLFLTARGPEALAPILEAYGQPIGVKQDAEDPFGPFTHQLRVFLIDRDGQIRNIYSLGFLDPRLVISDLRTLLLEEAKASQGM